jgi:hypothetical protein
MTSDDIQHVPLPGFTTELAQNLAMKIRATAHKGRRGIIKIGNKESMDAEDRHGGPTGPTPIEILPVVLKIMWEAVVHPIVGALKLEVKNKSFQPVPLYQIILSEI